MRVKFQSNILRTSGQTVDGRRLELLGAFLLDIQQAKLSAILEDVAPDVKAAISRLESLLAALADQARPLRAASARSTGEWDALTDLPVYERLEAKIEELVNIARDCLAALEVAG